jgi:hypothetical protein
MRTRKRQYNTPNTFACSATQYQRMQMTREDHERVIISYIW